MLEVSGRRRPFQLRHVGTYRRTIGASAERIWENALDWEHLPWLHRSSFTAISILESDRDMWRARVTLAGIARDALVIELRADRPRNTYVTRTLAGVGRGSEVHTRLEPRTERSTLVVIDFHVAGAAQLLGRVAGAIYTRLYARLWDEDEAMMRPRQTVLDEAAARRALRRGPARATAPEVTSMDLGEHEAVRRRTPFAIETPRGRLRIVALADELAVHPTACPHLGGPLDDVSTGDGTVTCPWHGYRFDIRSGRPVGEHKCRFRDMPQIEVDPATTSVRLVWSSTYDE